MDRQQVAKCWEDNAEGWIELSALGCDNHRNLVNTPGFLKMLPDVTGLHGLDVGCGDGYNTRLVAERCGRLTAIDLSATFLRHVNRLEQEEPRGVDCMLADAAVLPFRDNAFDFAVSIMTLMDMPEPEAAIREMHRVLKPGGFFQFSILHPCFNTPDWEWIRNKNGVKKAPVCGRYYEDQNGETEEWLFGAAPADLKEKYQKFRIPRFTRILSGWLNALLDAGFALERFEEPTIDEETAAKNPKIADHRLIAYTLMARCRK